MRVGKCLKYLKRGWKGTGERGLKDFKKEGKAGSRRGYLNKGGSGTPS